MKKTIDIFSVIALLFVIVLVAFLPIGVCSASSGHVIDQNLGISFYEKGGVKTITFLDVLNAYSTLVISFILFMAFTIVLCIIDFKMEIIATKIFTIISSLISLFVVSMIYSNGFNAASFEQFSTIPEKKVSVFSNVNKIILLLVIFSQIINLVFFSIKKQPKDNQISE